MEHNAETKGLCLKDQPQIHLFFHSLQMPIFVYINFSPFFLKKMNKQMYLYKLQYFLGKEQLRISGLSLGSCSFWFALWSSSQSTAWSVLEFLLLYLFATISSFIFRVNKHLQILLTSIPAPL